jgi:hypothetical protein
MRKFLLGVVIGIFLTAATAALSAENQIKIILDGRDIYSDVPPQIINDRTFVPIRVISEALGLDVQWDSARRAVILTSPENLPAFKVVSYNSVDTEYGYAIFGEVKNQSQKIFSTVKLKADVLDSSGNVVEILSTNLPPGVTPGETAYFKLSSQSGKRYLLDEVNFSFSTSDECSVTPTDIVFNEVGFSRDPNIYNDFTYVSGEIERKDNDLKRDYKHPLVQIALFNENGSMVNYGEKVLKDFERSKYGEFNIILEKGPKHSSYKLKCFSD